MITPQSYATAVEYRAVIGKESPTDDAAILADLTAISRVLDGKCDRFFGRDTEDVTRTYDGVDDTCLVIDDLSAAPTAITVAGHEQPLDALVLEPRNSLLSPEPRPYTRVRFPAALPRGHVVAVTGRWGWPAVPDAVRAATIQVTAILRLESARATRRVPELGDAIEASPDAQAIVRQLTDRYKRVRYA